MKKITWSKIDTGYACNQIEGMKLCPATAGRWKTEYATDQQYNGLIFGTKGEATSFLEKNFILRSENPDK